MEKILIDTDVIIDFLRGYHKRTKNVFFQIEQKKIKAFLSTISIVELYAGETAETEGDRSILKNLLSFFAIIPLDQQLSQAAGILKRKYEMGLADSIVAAISIEMDTKLFTFNVKHFKHLPEVKLYKAY